MRIFNGILEKPKGIRFESQEPRERVHFILRRHPITNVGWVSLTLIFIIIPPIAMTLLGEYKATVFKYFPPQFQVMFLILWYLATLFLAFEAFLLWYFNVYIITDKRLIDVDFRGLWTKRISEASYDNVEDVTYETTKFLHILFDYGNIFMQTAAERREFEFHAVPKPGIVHDKLTDLVEQFKHKHGRD